MNESSAAVHVNDSVMDDFVFGGIEADDGQLLLAMRQRTSGLCHRYQIEPADPQPHQPVRIRILSGPDVVFGSNHCICHDGWHTATRFSGCGVSWICRDLDVG